jgi:hypothetical protein
MSATRRAVQEVVEDASRREQLLVQVDEFEQLLIAQNAELQEAARALQALNADPAAERSAFEQVLTEHGASRRARRARLIDVHFAMIDLTTPKEWEVIVEREEQAFGRMLVLLEKG